MPLLCAFCTTFCGGIISVIWVYGKSGRSVRISSCLVNSTRVYLSAEGGGAGGAINQFHPRRDFLYLVAYRLIDTESPLVLSAQVLGIGHMRDDVWLGCMIWPSESTFKDVAAPRRLA